jgi:hypothetical protein
MPQLTGDELRLPPPKPRPARLLVANLDLAIRQEQELEQLMELEYLFCGRALASRWRSECEAAEHARGSTPLAACSLIAFSSGT